MFDTLALSRNDPGIGTPHSLGIKLSPCAVLKEPGVHVRHLPELGEDESRDDENDGVDGDPREDRHKYFVHTPILLRGATQNVVGLGE